MAQLFANNAAGKLAAPIDATDTTLVLETGQGERFPTLGEGDHFTVTLAEVQDGVEVAWEILSVIGRIGDTLTVARGFDESLPRAWAAGTIAELRLTAKFLGEMTGALIALNSAVTQKANLKHTHTSSEISGLPVPSGIEQHFLFMGA